MEPFERRSMRTKSKQDSRTASTAPTKRVCRGSDGDSDQRRISEKVALKKAELVTYLCELGWNESKARAESELYRYTAVIRASGTWLGAVDMTYKYHDGKFLCWRDILNKYSPDGPSEGAEQKSLRLATKLIENVKDTEEDPSPRLPPPLTGFTHWRAKKRVVKPDVYQLPPPPAPSGVIPVPATTSNAEECRIHRWRVGTLLIEAGISAKDIRQWSVKVAKRGRPMTKPKPFFVAPDGTTLCNYAAVRSYLKNEIELLQASAQPVNLKDEARPEPLTSLSCCSQPMRPQTRRGTRESGGRWSGMNSRSNLRYLEDYDEPVIRPVVKKEVSSELEELSGDEGSLLASLRLAHLNARLSAIRMEHTAATTEKYYLSDAEQSELSQIEDDDKEFFDSVVHLARLLVGSKHAVAYTGAGISTGAGADLPTIRGKFGVSSSQLKEEDFDPTSVERLRPTLAHMALVTLHQHGYLRFVCSQNIENLHRLSGVPENSLWEAHGNVCVANCPNCGKVFQSPPESKMCGQCWDPTSTSERRTWRTGMLRRNVISHYGAKVEVPMSAKTQSKSADFSLILGTSLSVQPFAKLAQTPSKLAIVNIERTRPFEAEERAKKHGARLWRSCDEVLELLLKLIGIEPVAAPTDSNLPAFLEHGEEELDVAAIFMGGRRPYSKPRDNQHLSYASQLPPSDNQPLLEDVQKAIDGLEVGPFVATENENQQRFRDSS